MKKRQNRNRKGFTLTEVLLVMAILVMIGGMAVVGILQAQKRATRDAALTEIAAMETACTQFRLAMNRFPGKLDDLFSPPQGTSPSQWGGPYLTNGDKIDPWGSDYTYKANEETMEVMITSPGPDRQAGTDDDVSRAKSS